VLLLRWSVLGGVPALVVGLVLLRPGASRMRRWVGAAACAWLPVGVGAHLMMLAPRVPEVPFSWLGPLYQSAPVAPHGTRDFPPRQWARIGVDTWGKVFREDDDVPLRMLAPYLAEAHEQGRPVLIGASRDAAWCHVSFLLHEVEAAGYDTVAFTVRRYPGVGETDEDLDELGMVRDPDPPYSHNRWYLQVPLAPPRRNGPVLHVAPAHFAFVPSTRFGAGGNTSVFMGIGVRYRIGDEALPKIAELDRRVMALDVHPWTPLKYVVAALDRCLAVSGEMPELGPILAAPDEERDAAALSYPVR